jgi:hypothetical protein
VNLSRILPALILLALVPARAQQSNRITVEQQEACTGLSNVECCEWTLRTAGFKSTGDHLPRLTIRAVQLSCTEPKKLANPAICRGIAFSRRFSASEVKALCDSGSIKKRCRENEACTRCVSELTRLGYGDSRWACMAVTYRRSGTPNGPVVVDLSDGKPPPTPRTDATRQEIKRRRRVE